jgi:hypothetical protein
VEKICSSRVDFWMIRLTRSFEGKTTVARLYAKFLMSIEISVGRIPIRIVFGGSPIQIFEKSGILAGIRIVFANIRTKISIRTKI